MSERAEQLRKAIALFSDTGEIATGLVAEDFVMHQANSIIGTAGKFEGPDALGGALSELREAFTELRFEVERVADPGGDRVVVLVKVRGRGRSSDLEIENHIGWVWKFRGRQAVELLVFEDPSEALAAGGLGAN